MATRTPALSMRALRLNPRPYKSFKRQFCASRAALSSSEMQTISVVGSFLFRRDPTSGKPKVALFQRSGQVKTYKHKFAPVSGKVDPHESHTHPLPSALRELHEETNLTPAISLRLLCAGAPYSFEDASVQRRWVIHPYAFAWPADVPEEPLRLDWENEGYEWFDPAVGEQGDVRGDGRDDERFTPRLADSLRRVYPEAPLGGMDAMIEHCLDASPAGRGAGLAVAKAMETWFAVIRDIPTHDGIGRDEWWRLARLAAWHVWNYRCGSPIVGAEILSPLLHALERLETLIMRQSDGSLPEDFGSLAVDVAATDAALSGSDEGSTSDKQESIETRADRYFTDLWTLR